MTSFLKHVALGTLGGLTGTKWSGGSKPRKKTKDAKPKKPDGSDPSPDQAKIDAERNRVSNPNNTPDDVSGKPPVGAIAHKVARNLKKKKPQFLGKVPVREDHQPNPHAERVKRKKSNDLLKCRKNAEPITTKEEAEMEDIELTVEEAAALYELSKKVLGSYVKKASANMADAEYQGGHAAAKRDEPGQINHALKSFRRSEKRGRGIVKAVDRITKEDVQLNEGLVPTDGPPAKTHMFLHNHSPKGMITGARRSTHADGKVNHNQVEYHVGKEHTQKVHDHLKGEGFRHVGNGEYHKGSHTDHHIARVKEHSDHTVVEFNRFKSGKKKLTKEDVGYPTLVHAVLAEMYRGPEQIDELSRKTLASYAKKAAVSAATKTHSGAEFGNSQRVLKGLKRAGMVGKAVDKLAKD